MISEFQFPRTEEKNVQWKMLDRPRVEFPSHRLCELEQATQAPRARFPSSLQSALSEVQKWLWLLSCFLTLPGTFLNGAIVSSSAPAPTSPSSCFPGLGSALLHPTPLLLRGVWGSRFYPVRIRSSLNLPHASLAFVWFCIFHAWQLPALTPSCSSCQSKALLQGPGLYYP